MMSRSTGLERFHAQDRCDPLVWSLLPMGIWMAALSGSVAVESVPAAVILSIIGGVAGSQLFVIGHDACHGSLTKSRLLNALIGRMAFVPSAHSFSLWAYFHNGLHHNFTNLRGHDFVWTPLSPDEFSRLSKVRQFMECIYRHPTGAGFGLYYAIELWRRRLAWPTRIVPRRVAPSAYADVATTVTTWLLVGSPTALLFELDVLEFLGGMALFAGVSLMIITWAIGFVVYFNHTHPRLKWYGMRGAMARRVLPRGRGLPRHVQRHLVVCAAQCRHEPYAPPSGHAHPRAPSGGRRDAPGVRHRYAPPVLALDRGAPLRGDETLRAV
jgi:fatty acid desaturase